MSDVSVESGVELGETEATGVVRMGKNRKQKPHVSNERFIEVYQSSETAAKAASVLGMTVNNLYLRAKKIREVLGVPLKDGFERAEVDVSALTELAKRFAPKS